jgi:hypothetical protein
MSSKANVTTPGGFFVGLGGIVCFSVVAAAVFWWVKTPAENTELRPQQIALGLRAPADAKGDDVQKKDKETKTLLDEAKARYNGGASPDIDNLDDLRGVVRYREAQKTIAEAGKALTGAVAWKDKAKGEVTMPISLAMNVVANGLKDRKPKPSAVKVDISPALDPKAPPMMPNAMGGGANTVFFADPNAVPAAAPAPAAPATPPAPAPAAPAAQPATPPAVPAASAPAAVPPPPAAIPPAAPAAPAPAPNPPQVPAAPASPASDASISAPASVVASNVPAPARPTLLNWPESKK